MTASEIANTELVLLAMVLAGAGDDFADLEDIAEKAYYLSPQRFGWRTRLYPSDKIVVQSIADLEAKHKSRLTLRGKDKMATRRLTTEGRKAAIQVAGKVAGREFRDVPSVIAHFEGHGPDAPIPTPAERRRAQADLSELRRHRTFLAWLDDPSDLSAMDRWELLDALSCLPDAPSETITQQIENLAALAEKWEDRDVTRYLDSVSALISALGSGKKD